MFRLAHVTDPHFRGFDGLTLGAFAGKRAIGLLNLAVNRRRHHKTELLAALGDDLRAEAPDHMALTGDLSNISLDGEWRAALRWLEQQGAAPATVTVIPGNHDAYVAEVVRAGAFEKLFGQFQTGDVDGVASGAGGNGAGDGDTRQRYPFVRLRGPLALIGVNSCVATGDLGAWGEVGAEQLARLEALLGHAEVARRIRVVLIHHPPVMHKGGEARNLKDRARWRRCSRAPAPTSCCTATTTATSARILPGAGGRRIPIIGAGSASYAGGPEKRARYNIYELDESGQITLVTRAHDEASDRFKEVRREKLV